MLGRNGVQGMQTRREMMDHGGVGDDATVKVVLPGCADPVFVPRLEHARMSTTTYASGSEGVCPPS
jgi:hypothetical protein